MQRIDACFKEALDVARRLPNTLLILDHRDANITLAMLSEGNTWRHNDARFLDHECRERHAADILEFVRQRCPREHRRCRWRNIPTGTAE